jgi:hypothetical protein
MFGPEAVEALVDRGYKLARRGMTPEIDYELGKNQVGPLPTIATLPWGRHPRIGLLEGALDPRRGTKASIFLPWDPTSYLVVDLPEAIFSNLGLIFLAHTHVPTVRNDQNEVQSRPSTRTV